jgi:hypothetical protein
MRRAIRLLVLTCPVLVAACASLYGATDVPTPEEAGEEGPDSSGGSSGGAESGGNEAGDASDAGDASTSASGVGFIDFSQASGGAGRFGAVFTPTPFDASPGNCTVTDAGACTTTSCAEAPQSSRQPSLESAGALTVTGGLFGTDGGYAIAPVEAGVYLYAPIGNLFASGDTLGVAAAGATVPAFPTETVIVPPAITLTAPTLTGKRMSIPTATDLTLQWTQGQLGATVYFSALVVFTAADGGPGGGASVTCSWSASSGTGLVPHAALAPLAEGAGGNGTMTWYQAGQTHFEAGSWPITISAYMTQGATASFFMDAGEGGPLDVQCAAMSSTNCYKCCEGDYAAGYSAFTAAIKGCECGDAGGVCQSACVSSFCASPQTTPAGGSACNTCIESSLAAGGACEAVERKACPPGSGCDAYLNCSNGCP